VYSIGIQNNFKNTSLGKIKTEDNKSTSVNTGVPTQNPIKQPSFRAALPPVSL